MSKRKVTAAEGPLPNGKSKLTNSINEDSSDESDTDMLDVDFEWFDPSEIDFHGLKLLLRQLFDADHDLFDLSAISNLIVSQPLLGSTVKVPEDGVEINQTDPFAFLTVLNLHTHAADPSLKPLTAYLSQKALTIPSLSTTLPPLLSPTSPAQIGLILTERFINMPPEIIPPLYKMLLEEIQWALDENEPYAFSHYLILSKTYTEITSLLPSQNDNGDNDSMIIDDERPQKKSKKVAEKEKGKGAAVVAAATMPSRETFYFHAEDEPLQRFAVGFGDYEFSKKVDSGASDSKRAFQEAGIRPLGHMILIEAGKFGEAVREVERYIGGGI